MGFAQHATIGPAVLKSPTGANSSPLCLSERLAFFRRGRCGPSASLAAGGTTRSARLATQGSEEIVVFDDKSFMKFRMDSGQSGSMLDSYESHFGSSAGLFVVPLDHLERISRQRRAAA